MFWGLVLEPSKRYTQKVQQSFHISQAALEINTADFEPVQLILEYDGANYILATLSRKFNVYQIPLDLNFNTGDQISFRTIGKGRVHLTGYHILEDDLEDMVLNGEEQSDLEEEEEEESSPSKLDSSKQVKRKKPDSSKNVNNKKSKLSGKNEVEASDEDSDDEDAADDFDVDMSDSDDEDDGEEEDDECEEEEDDDDEDDEDDDDDMELGDADEDEDDEELEEENTEGKKKQGAANKLNKSNVSINGKSPKSKKPTNDSKSTPKPDKKNAVATPGKDTKEKEVKTPKSEKKSPKSEKKGKENKGGGGGESSPQKKVLEGGVIVEELKTGEGQAAKPGKMAQVYYVGRLQSNKKQFDATTQGPGFRFRLGKGEVIRGWDIGVCGMKVGGKRRITIPPQLAYGAKGAPPAIPPNSTLVFEVELKGLN